MSVARSRRTAAARPRLSRLEARVTVATAASAGEASFRRRFG
jgi:hypothetical protein